MNPITVILPPVPQSLTKPLWFTTAPTLAFWFPDNESRDVYLKALGLSDIRAFLLQSGEYQLMINMFVGTSGLAKLSMQTPRVFYLSPRMFSGEPYFAKPQPPTATISYSFCLLSKTQLAWHDGEILLIEELYNDAKRIFHTTPFLGRNVAEDYPTFKQWLAEIVLLINVQQLKEHSTRRLNTAHDYAQTLLYLKPSGSIECTEQLLALLALRQHGSGLSTYIERVTMTKCRAFEVFETLPNTLNQSAKGHIDKTYEYIYHIPFNPTLGNEVLPELRRASRTLRTFAEHLKGSLHTALQNIGEEMLGHLEKRTPILALTGTFSSGKTTLLNSLLIGQDTSYIRAFRTKPGANTAIVSEITYVGAGKTDQRVEFEYRKKITNFTLATITLDDSKILKGYVQEMYVLLERGVLTNAELKIMPIHPQSSRGSIEVHSAHDIQTYLRYLFHRANDEDASLEVSEHTNSFPAEDKYEGIYIFSAEVIAETLMKEYLRPPNEQENPDGTVRYRLPQTITLTTDEGWIDFQGQISIPQSSKKGGRVSRKQNLGQTVEHWTEQEIASLLIERSRVYLNHNLLELTTIADTPGTDSSNSGHDYVTKEYLQDASAYVLLLPTKLVDSSRTNMEAQDSRNAENNILRQLTTILKNDIRRIAFVVNCWPIDESTNIQDKIKKYEQIICKAFNIPQYKWDALQRDPIHRNFFVVQLKNIQTGERPSELHGYPSLLPLQSWVEKTFRSGAYRARYDTLLDVLSSGWQQNHNIWKQKLQNLYQDAEKIQRLCDNLRRFIQDLHVITKAHLDDIRLFRQNFTSQGSRVSRMMREYGDDPKRYKKGEDLTPWHTALKAEYIGLNDLLQNFAHLHALEAWIREVKDKSKSLPIALPALVPEDPAAQSPSWSHGREFSSYDIDTEFTRVAGQWPESLWKKFIGLFKDSRITLVKELQDFWNDQYSQIWSGGLRTYLDRCEQFLEKQQQAIQAITQKELTLQEELNDPVKRKQREQEFKAVIAAFDELNIERQNLHNQLRRALTPV